MMRVDDLVAAISSLQRSDLEAWIREELVVPRQEAGTLLFTDMECARVRLICTLHYELEIDAGTLPVVLSLVDQLYDTRQRLLSLTAAVTAQDENVQVGDHRCYGAECRVLWSRQIIELPPRLFPLKYDANSRVSLWVQGGGGCYGTAIRRLTGVRHACPCRKSGPVGNRRKIGRSCVDVRSLQADLRFGR